jgi:hypothetical protein
MKRLVPERWLRRNKLHHPIFWAVAITVAVFHVAVFLAVGDPTEADGLVAGKCGARGSWLFDAAPANRSSVRATA